MVPKIYEAIDRAVAQGIPPEDVAKLLIGQGLPAELVNDVTHNWMVSHGRERPQTNFKQWLIPYQGAALVPLITVVIFGAVGSLVMLLRPWPTKIMVDSAFGSIPAPWILEPYTQTTKLILITSVMTVGIFAVSSLVNSLRDYIQVKLGLKINQALKEKLFLHVMNIPVNKGHLTKGDYIYRQNTLTDSLSEYLINSRAATIQAVFMIASILVVMCMINAKLTLITAVLIPAIYVLTRLLSPRVTAFSRHIAQNTSAAASTVNESVDNTETIQSFDMAPRQLAKASALWNQNFSLITKSLIAGRTYRISNSLAVIIATSTVMYLGGVAALNGEVTLGELLIFMTYMNYLQSPVQNIVNQVNQRSQKRMDLMRIHEVVEEYEGVENTWVDRHFPLREGNITLSGVSYSYGSREILSNINLEIPAKQKVGIIGPSGSGKTTFLKLLSLFNEPTNGQIVIDGIDIQSISLQEYRSSISIVNQNPQLFNTSITENILDGNKGGQITTQEFDEIINATGVAELAQTLPSHLDTVAGENGGNLSGGQRQKISLARALAKKTPILFMDEPTASLDSDSENKIKNALPQLIKDKTVVLVSHRKALLALMDVIYVLEQGQLYNIDQFGGLDAYLTRINDADNELAVRQTKLEEARLLEQVQHDRDRKRLEELEQANSDLQQRISTSSPESSSTDGVTISISH
ncbi:MAG: ATP-binding cassette domain-containing protein [Patescibacteria group bacterium]